VIAFYLVREYFGPEIVDQAFATIWESGTKLLYDYMLDPQAGVEGLNEIIKIMNPFQK
jgi:hypothetical protein